MAKADRSRRWDIDERGIGVADASVAVPRLAALQEHASRPNWVTEDPDAHLWPHLDQAIRDDGSPWQSAGYTIDEDGTLLVALEHVSPDGDRQPAQLRADVLALVGTIVEGVTFVEIHESSPGEDVVIEVVTGVLDDQTPFRSHGHTLRLRIRQG